MGILPSFSPTHSTPSPFRHSLEASDLLSDYCCHLLSQNKTAMALPFFKRFPLLCTYWKQLLKSVVEVEVSGWCRPTCFAETRPVEGPVIFGESINRMCLSWIFPDLHFIEKGIAENFWPPGGFSWLIWIGGDLVVSAGLCHCCWFVFVVNSQTALST